MENIENEEINDNSIEQVLEPEKTPVFKKIFKEVFEFLCVVAIAIIVAMLIRQYVMIIGYVPTSSMYDTINKNDRVIINRLAYLFEEPQRGDIVSFHYPDNEAEIYIKRIIGLPGDKIEGKNGKVYINDEPLSENYTDGAETSDFGPYIVPDESYFMMGDNRTNSLDSRYWENKFVSKEKIIGKSTLRIYPKIGVLSGAEY